MPVSAAISAQLSALQVAVAAAGNLDAAPFSVANALAYQAGLLAAAVEGAIPAAAGALDTFTAPLMPVDISAGVLGLLSAAQTQSALADLEGFVARIQLNLENR
jgi:hypothetical protein